jgi:hypothetical protein
MAAGTESIEAIKKCCIKLISSNFISSMLTRAIMTDPATVAIPVVINISNSFFDKSFR